MNKSNLPFSPNDIVKPATERDAKILGESFRGQNVTVDTEFKVLIIVEKGYEGYDCQTTECSGMIVRPNNYHGAYFYPYVWDFSRFRKA